MRRWSEEKEEGQNESDLMVLTPAAPPSPFSKVRIESFGSEAEWQGPATPPLFLPHRSSAAACLSAKKVSAKWENCYQKKKYKKNQNSFTAHFHFHPSIYPFSIPASSSTQGCWGLQKKHCKLNWDVNHNILTLKNNRAIILLTLVYETDMDKQ